MGKVVASDSLRWGVEDDIDVEYVEYVVEVVVQHLGASTCALYLRRTTP